MFETQPESRFTVPHLCVCMSVCAYVVDTSFGSSESVNPVRDTLLHFIYTRYNFGQLPPIARIYDRTLYVSLMELGVHT